MRENFEQKTSEQALSYQTLRNSCEKLDSPAQRLSFLIKSFDKVLFPDNPLTVEITEKIGEGGSISLGRYRDKEGKTEKWQYEISEDLNEKEESFETILGIAIHEVRHRLVRKEKRPLEIVENLGKLRDLMLNFPNLQEYQQMIEKNERMRESAHKGQEKEKLPPEIEKEEFDARAIEIIGKKIMEEKSMSVNELADEIINTDFSQALINVNKRLAG